MVDQDFSKSKILRNIPRKKLELTLNLINNDSSLDDKQKNLKITALNRYFESNIPVEYWDLSMEKDFKGDKSLMDNYNEYTKDILNSYITGNSICLAGNHGVGKTLAMCSMLKKATWKNYNCLYINLTDMVSALILGNEDSFYAKKELSKVDFLVIDEFDPRFMASDNAIDLYARLLETIFRSRANNKLPTIMATNSPNLLESLKGSLKTSLSSLFSGYIKMIPVFGSDYRKEK